MDGGCGRGQASCWRSTASFGFLNNSGLISSVCVCCQRPRYRRSPPNRMGSDPSCRNSWRGSPFLCPLPCDQMDSSLNLLTGSPLRNHFIIVYKISAAAFMVPQQVKPLKAGKPPVYVHVSTGMTLHLDVPTDVSGDPIKA